MYHGRHSVPNHGERQLAEGLPMKIDKIRHAATWSVALLLLAVASCNSSQHAKTTSTKHAAMAEAPADLKVDGPVVATVHATGFQIYTATADDAGKLSWKLKAPQATFSGDGLEGTHFAGPTWKSNTDGSSVKGKKLREHANPGAVPLLLIEAVGHDGNGKLAAVTYIQRLNTTGGVAPPIGDAKAGDEIKVPYTADYVFFGPGSKPAQP
jgi:hypothetical protein